MSSQRPRRSRFQSCFSRLEDRLAPALSTTFDSVSGLLTVTSDASDAIVLGDLNRDGIMDLNGAPIVVLPGQQLRNSDVSQVVVNGGPGPNGIDLAAMRGKVKDIRSNPMGRFALSGPNSVSDLGCPIVINGGAGNDTITGSIFDDDIDGGAGADILLGGAGNDVLRCELTDTTMDGQGGTNGAIVSLKGLPPGTPVIQTLVDVDNDAVTVNYAELPTVTNFSRLHFIHFDAGDFGTSSGSATVKVGGTSANPAASYKAELKEVIVTNISVSSDSSGGGHDTPIESLSFNFSKIQAEYQWKGNGGNDRIVVTPGRSKVVVDGGAGDDTVVVNHGGYPFTQTPTELSVSTKGPISVSNVETQDFVRIISGDAAIDALRILGVTASAELTTGKHKDWIELLGVVTNSGPVTFTSGSMQINPNDSWELLRTTSSPGTNFKISPRIDDFEPLIEVANGVYPYQTELTLEFATLPGGTTVSGTVMGTQRRSGETSLGDFVIVRLEGGGTIYEFDLPVERTVGQAKGAGPVTLAGVNPTTGQTSSDAAVTLVAADASGVPVIRSTSTQIDSQAIVTLPMKGHLYQSSVAVDVRSGTLELGNDHALGATVDYAGRFVAFESAATNLDPATLDSNGQIDIFLRDSILGTTRALSASLETGMFQTGNGESRAPQVSGDGRFVVFESKASDLIPGLPDMNNDFDVFRYEIATGSLQCLSLNVAKTATGDKGVFSSTVSADGETICWLTEATNVNPGSSTGMQVATYRKALYEWIKHSYDGSARLKLSGDGGVLLYWTPADVSSLAGVPDTNGTFDLLAIQLTTGIVTPLSMNGASTAMGDGSTPAFNVGNDPPDISFDGQTIVFTSNADDLLSGAATPTTGGIFKIYGFVPGVVTVVKDRIDKTPGGGFGGDNSQVTISSDGFRVGFVSKHNYETSSPATYPDDQVWAFIKLTDIPGEMRLSSGKHMPGAKFATAAAGPSSNPLFTNEGILFETGAVIADFDGDALQDVVMSRLDRTLVWVTPTGNGADEALVTRKDITIEIRNQFGIVVNLNPRELTDSVYIKGADNEPDSVTLDFEAGLTSLLEITLDGGAGLGNVVVAKSSRKDMLQWYQDMWVSPLDNGVEVTAARFHEWTWETSIGKATPKLLELHGPGGGGGGGAFDIELSITTSGGFVVITRDPGSPGEKKVKINDFKLDRISAPAASISAKVDLPAGTFPADSTFGLYAGPGDDNIDASLSAFAVTLSGGAGNDTITGGSNGDMLIGGSGKNKISNSKTHHNPDNICLVAGGDDTITDNDPKDTIDFSMFESGGVIFDMDATTMQPIAPSGERIQVEVATGILIGSPFGDSVAASIGLPKITPKIAKESHGRFGVTPPGDDTLTIDVQNLPTTDFGGRIVTPGKGDIVYDEFEHVNFINQPPNQVALTVVNDGAIQRSMVTKLQTSFNFNPMFVGLPSEAFQVVTKVGGVVQPISVAPPEVINGFMHVTITPNGSVSFNNGRFLLRVLSSQIVGGLAGGDYTFEFHRNFGDDDGDGTVTSGDFAAFRKTFGTAINLAFDSNNNGQIDSDDFQEFRKRFGLTE